MGHPHQHPQGQPPRRAQLVGDAEELPFARNPFELGFVSVVELDS